MRADEVHSYLQETSSVEGWFFPVDAHLFGVIDEMQKARGISGDLFEIGVHHGKTALLLIRMSSPGEMVRVCDVFGRQDLNIDGSGEGSRGLFEEYVARFTKGGASALKVFEQRSETLTVAQTSTNCRFFHIDGGHLPDIVEADLETAVAAIHSDGVVVVDDVFNPSWPGVVEGFFRFMTRRSLVPLIIGGNKVFLVRPDAFETYSRLWDEMKAGDEIVKRLPFTFERKTWLGHQVITAVRHHWVDLDPSGAAEAHLRRRNS